MGLAERMDNRWMAGQLGVAGRTAGKLAEHAGELETGASTLSSQAAELALQVTRFGTRTDVQLPLVTLPGAGTVVTRSGAFTLNLPVTELVEGRMRIVQVFIATDKIQNPVRSSTTVITAALTGGSGGVAQVPPAASQPGDTPQTLFLMAVIPANQPSIQLNWTYQSSYRKQPVPAGEPNSITERGVLKDIYMSTSVGSA